MRATLLVGALLLAGCTVEPPVLEGALPGERAAPLGPGSLDASTRDLAAPLPAPAWQVGYAWRYAITDSEGGPGGTQPLVVVRDLGTDWLLGSTELGAALDAAFEGRSTFGRISKETLSGYAGGQNTRFFEFPLRDNATWTAFVRSAGAVPLQARAEPNVDGHGPGFVVEGRSGTAGLRIHFAERVAWMTRFELMDPDGSPRFTRTLQAHDRNHTGPWYLASAEELYVAARNGTTGLPVETFDQGKDFALLRVRVRAEGQGLGDLRLLDPANQLRFNLTATGPTDLVADLPAMAGTWRAVWTLAGPLAVDVRVAGLAVEQGEVGR